MCVPFWFLVAILVASTATDSPASAPRTPALSWDEAWESQDEFRPASPIRAVASSHSRPPASVVPSSPARLEEAEEEVIDSAPAAPRRLRLPADAHRSLQDRVLRKATYIALRRESKKKYAAKRKQDKFNCSLCGVFLNSRESRKAHVEGRKHKAKEAAAASGPKTCSYCNVTVRTQKEFDAHLHSRRHFSICKHRFNLLDAVIPNSF